jgi:hypothetical protein
MKNFNFFIAVPIWRPTGSQMKGGVLLQAVLHVHNRFAHSELCFEALNLVWACTLVAPMVVLYWKGTWDLLADLVSNTFNCCYCL